MSHTPTAKEERAPIRKAELMVLMKKERETLRTFRWPFQKRGVRRRAMADSMKKLNTATGRKRSAPRRARVRWSM